MSDYIPRQCFSVKLPNILQSCKECAVVVEKKNNTLRQERQLRPLAVAVSVLTVKHWTIWLSLVFLDLLAPPPRLIKLILLVH